MIFTCIYGGLPLTNLFTYLIVKYSQYMNTTLSQKFEIRDNKSYFTGTYEIILRDSKKTD